MCLRKVRRNKSPPINQTVTEALDFLRLAFLITVSLSLHGLHCSPFKLEPMTFYLSNAIERVQKRVMSIIYPNLSYDESLSLSGLVKLSCRREEACKKLFNEIVNTGDHKLTNLLPPKQETKYDLRQFRPFTDYRAKTNRFLNSFIPSSVRAFNAVNCK